MIDINFLEITNSSDEIDMGMKLHFNNFNNSMQFDAISATANTGGFTPLTAIARYYRWNHLRDRRNSSIIGTATEQCNNRNEIAVVNELKPVLLLVPRTRGNNTDPFLISDLLNACNSINIKTLRFTHYCFIQGRFPQAEIETIFTYILNMTNQISLRKIIYDIDARHYQDILQIYNKISNIKKND